jgi:hypothetical protein
MPDVPSARFRVETHEGADVDRGADETVDINLRK